MAAVYLICDLSGSMAENGKTFVVRNLIRTVDQVARLRNTRNEMKLVLWSNLVEMFDWTLGDDVPQSLMQCKPSELSGAALKESLSVTPEDFLMLFTDGYWSDDVRKALGILEGMLIKGHFRIVKIGEDAESRVKGPSVFSAEDLLAALDGWAE